MKNEKRIKLVQVYSDIAGHQKGASHGIDALQQISDEKQSRYFKQFASEVILHENNAFKEKSVFKHAKYIDKIYKVIKRVAYRIKTLKEESLFPIVFSGDHASCAGVMHGLKMAYPKEEIGVVYIDAHADIHSPYTSVSGNMHGMPLAIACALDNKTHKINNLNKEEVIYWERLKQLSHTTQAIKPENVIFCGLRDFERAEEHLITEHNIQKYSAGDITYFGIKHIVEAIFQKLSHCQHIYVSFDVDSIDPLYIPGTGTPASKGLSLEQAMQLNMQLIKNEKVCAWEISEINPLLDSNDQSATFLFELVEKVTQMLVKNY
jgi:arginase